MGSLRLFIGSQAAHKTKNYRKKRYYTYHIYLTAVERRVVINSLIELRNDLISRGKYTDIIDELIIKFTKAKVKKIKIKEV